MNPEVTQDFETENDSRANGNDSTPSGASSGLADTVSGVVSQIQDHVGPAVSQTQQKAGDLAGKVQKQAASRLDEHKSQAADSLGSVAQALRQTSQQVGEQDQGLVTQYAGRYGNVMADQVERVSTYLNERSTQDIVHEVEDFARRDPAIFIGGAFLLGLLGARLLKSAPATGSNFSSPSSSSTMPAPVASTPVQTETFAAPSGADAGRSWDAGPDGLSTATGSTGSSAGEPAPPSSDPFYNADDPGPVVAVSETAERGSSIY